MFHTTDNTKCNFLEQTKAAREERALEKHKDNSATKLQANIKGWLTRRKFTKNILKEFDETIPETNENAPKLKPAIEIFTQINRLMLVWNYERDKERFIKLSRYLIITLESETPKYNYVGVALNKNHLIRWITVMNRILWICCEYLNELKPELTNDMKLILLFLHVLISFTSTANWMLLKQKNMDKLQTGMNQLCHNLMGQLFHKGFYLILKDLLIKGLGRIKIVFTHTSLSAIFNLALRPMIAADFSDKLMTMFLIHILSVPALINHLDNLAPECINTLKTHDFFGKTLEFLSGQQSMRIIFNALEGNYALCLLANLVHLSYLELDKLQTICHTKFIEIIINLMESCQNYVINHKQTNQTHWHPVLGWFSQPIDSTIIASMSSIKLQLQLLWNRSVIELLLGNNLMELIDKMEYRNLVENQSQMNGGRNFFKRVFESRTNRFNNTSIKSYQNFNNPDIHRIILVCALYHTTLNTFTQLQLDILTGLCYQNLLLYYLWLFLLSLGPNCGLKLFLEQLIINTKTTTSEFQMLQLFCDCMTHYVTILDDIEMYERQNPFKLQDFVILSNFLNQFLYKTILGNLFDLKTIHTNALFQSLHTLLLLLYKRDARKNYTPSGHWLIKDIKISTFINDLDKEHKITLLLLQTMPHIIPHDDRVRLFRKFIMNEKTMLGLTESSCASPHSTVITVHRSRIVEDGYRQLALIPSQSLKGVIRVRFINEQGLDEAGIDQDGVFKEFLEESIKRIFNPSLNLFRITSDECLYPSPTSHLQDNHLQLFEFVGRLLGKAIYEGIVVDVPFATFFLNQISKQNTHNILYSCIDELSSLDLELYRNLTCIKHYNGDVNDLDLTFSLNEDSLGKLITHELIPGGKAIPVTNENKINYIHLMAHFRMHLQIKDQTQAFIRGFRSIINPDWLTIFSTPELQRLISGDNVPLNMKDLRKHTQYYGGFHDSHRVICWLWDILDKDFNHDEKGMFLKFVTSCSKPPLLGFGHLEPPFSIRCVEVGDDEDTGDTIGSIFRGFFTIRKKDPQNRLPTSSTCFNLLKLPNYQKKITLREKLRYAITFNTGFELS